MTCVAQFQPILLVISSHKQGNMLMRMLFIHCFCYSYQYINIFCPCLVNNLTSSYFSLIKLFPRSLDQLQLSLKQAVMTIPADGLTLSPSVGTLWYILRRSPYSANTLTRFQHAINTALITVEPYVISNPVTIGAQMLVNWSIILIVELISESMDTGSQLKKWNTLSKHFHPFKHVSSFTESIGMLTLAAKRCISV